MKLFNTIKYIILAEEKAMKLEKTVDLMLSDKYPDRLKAEYQQTVYRRNKLKDTIKNTHPNDPQFYLLKWQLRVMDDYIYVLKERAEVEAVDIK